MNKKRVFIFSSILLIIVIICSIIYFSRVKQIIPQLSQNVKSEVLKSNAIALKDPEVLQIRQALNAYLNGSISATSNSALLINGDPKMDKQEFIITGLKNFSKEYYKSKYIAFNTRLAPGNGEIIYIEFVDKPDKVFTVGVFKTSNGTYELQYFGQNLQVTLDRIQKLNAQYNFLLKDKAHAL